MKAPPQTRTKRERFLPYAHERFGLSCRITAVDVDGREGPEPDLDRHLLALEDPDFDVLTVHGVLTTPKSTLGAVFPGEERRAPMAMVCIVVRCGRTRLRRSVIASASPLCPGDTPFIVQLGREEVDGSVELHPILLRADGAQAPAPGYATERWTRLASGRAWTVRVDPLPESPGRFLDTRYRRFSQDAALRAWADTVFRLELSESPTLWINADHERVQRVLDDRGTRGPAARIREATFDVIAQSVWTQLFLQASLDLRETGQLIYPWQESVLRELLPELVHGERSHAARLAQLRKRLDRGELGDLIGQLTSVLQRRNRLAAHLEKLVQETAERST